MATSLISSIARKLSGSRLFRDESGATSVWVALGMLPLVGFAAVAVDVGTVAVAKVKLQRAADAGAHAGVKAMRDGEGAGSAASQTRAVNVAVQNMGALLASGAVTDVEFGSYDLGADVFTVGVNPDDGVPAVQVQASAQVPLVFAPAVGISSASFSVEAVSGGRRREVVIVQDISGSFAQEIGDAEDADQSLVQQMSDQDVPGDRVGVVTFSSSAAVRQPLTLLETGTGAVLNSLEGLTTGGGTNTAAGINLAVDLFQASDPTETERVIIIVTDGQPNSLPAAEAAADDAFFNNGVHIFTLLLNVGGSGAASANNAALVRGIGTPFETSDPDSLEDLLLVILGALPILLVG